MAKSPLRKTPKSVFGKVQAAVINRLNNRQSFRKIGGTAFSDTQVYKLIPTFTFTNVLYWWTSQKGEELHKTG